jgi:hypothetical protein
VKRRKALIFIALAAVVAYSLALVFFFQDSSRVPTTEEQDLLTLDCKPILAHDHGVLMLMDVDPPFVDDKLTKNGFRRTDLTEAEQKFMGLRKVGAKRCEFRTLAVLSQQYFDKHGSYPVNAAQIVLADEHEDAELFIALSPHLVNHATGKLYASFSEGTGPLGVKLRPVGISFFSSWFMRPGTAPANTHHWHITVLRENGSDVLINENFSFSY